MADIAGGRSDQLCNLMTVLKLGTIDFDKSPWSSEKDLRSCFNYSRLPGTGRSLNQQLRDWTSWSIQTGQVRLVDTNELVNRTVLPYDLTSQLLFKFCDVRSSFVGIQHHFLGSLNVHGLCLLG